jgi:cysteine desulfurase
MDQKIEAILIVAIIVICWELLKYVFNLLYRTHKPDVNIFEEYIYFDANATTPMIPASRNAFINSAYSGNASTDYAHHVGDIPHLLNKVSKLIRTRLLIDDSYRIVWNSGASEGNNYVIRSIADTPTQDGSIPHIIAGSTEHKTSLLCLESLSKAGKIQYTLVYPNLYGVIDPIQIAESIKPNTRLITIMHTNNETGSVNPISEISRVAAKYDILFHTDAAQAFGKARICMTNIDALTASMHKVYGPPGLGLLILSSRFSGQAQISGTQFDGLRGGTENIPGIAASYEALKYVWTDRTFKNAKLHAYKHQIVSALDKEFGIVPYMCMHDQPDTYRYYDGCGGLRVIVLGETDPRFGYPSMDSSPSTLLLSIVREGDHDDQDRFCNINLKRALFDRKIIISIGSACNTGQAGPSHVLRSIKAPYIVRSGAVRISMLDTTTDADIKKLIENLIEVINRQK